MLVDLEALFHPLDEPMGSAELFFPDTVLRIGFLPTADWGGGPGEAGADLSGLAAMEEQFHAPADADDRGRGNGSDAVLPPVRHHGPFTKMRERYRTNRNGIFAFEGVINH